MPVLMCPPSHYAIRYEINPWMKLKNPIHPATARSQWQALERILRRLGVRIWRLPQDRLCPDMVFTANAGLARRRVFIPSHFRFPQRRAETAAFTRYFKKRGYRIADVSEGLYFEGEGDLLPYRDWLFAGYRFRSELLAHEKVAGFLRRRVIALELTQPRFYHLDTCFFPLDDRTAFYYPAAFDRYGRQAIKRFVENPVAVGPADAVRFACNAFRAGRTVVLSEGSRAMMHRLHQLGYQTAGAAMSEFVKAGGSVKCLLLTL